MMPWISTGNWIHCADCTVKTKASLKVLNCRYYWPSHIILLDKQPFNSQVGIIGHELAHTCHYSTMGFFSITGMGIAYVTPWYRSRYEKLTDFETIKHGLGWQLLEFAGFARSRPSATEKTIRWLDKFYLNPEEIKMFMNEMPELYDPG